MDLSYGAVGITYVGETATYKYQLLKHKETRQGYCPLCHKRNKRSRTFGATVNPFNKDPASGRPRSREQVWETLRERGRKWELDFVCYSHEQTHEEG